jgi:hypothetical protein
MGMDQGELTACSNAEGGADEKLQGWFDEGTRRKIHILGKDPGSVLLEQIESSNLPKAYGGELEWDFLDAPNLDSAAKDAVGGAMPTKPTVFSACLENGTV